MDTTQKALTSQKSPRTRWRRGKLVEIQPEWAGKTIYKQNRRKRQKDAWLKHFQQGKVLRDLEELEVKEQMELLDDNQDNV